MNKKEAILDLDELTLEQIEFLLTTLDRSFDITPVKEYRNKRASESGPSNINYLKVPETLGEELEIILGSNEEYEYLEFIDYIKKIRDLERGEKEIMEEGMTEIVADSGMMMNEVAPDLIVDLKHFHPSYIDNLVKFLKGSEIRCEEYNSKDSNFAIFDGTQVYFTEIFIDACVEVNISEFVQKSLFSVLWPKINSQLSTTHQEVAKQPKQATLIDIARHMVIESQNQGIELGIGEDGLFTFKVLMPQEQKNSL